MTKNLPNQNVAPSGRVINFLKDYARSVAPEKICDAKDVYALGVASGSLYYTFNITL